MPKRKPYPTDVSDEEWAFVAPYLTLLVRQKTLRSVTTIYVRHSTRCEVDREGRGSLAHDAKRLPAVGSRLPTEAKGALCRGGLRGDGPRPTRSTALGPGPGEGAHGGRAGQPHAALHSRERAPWRLYDGAKRKKKGSKVHAAAALDTLGHLLTLRVTPATEQERTQVEALAEAVQEATGESVELAYYVERG